MKHGRAAEGVVSGMPGFLVFMGESEQKEVSMVIHNSIAIQRDIRFVEHIDVQTDIRASDCCCWNCLSSVMTYECLWCEREMDTVDFRDLCVAWKGESVRSNA
ncbi:MAG: hypothetical protein AB1442_07430 [Nitrospirota bacterium]